MKFRKKPVVIEAIQLTADNLKECCQFVGRSNTSSADPDAGTFSIYTLEGSMRADVGDWIIKGVKGEFYPCKPDIFAATYEPLAAFTPAEPPQPIHYPGGAWLKPVALAKPQTPEPPRPCFRCPTCGPTAVDEDGRCRACGADAPVILPAAPVSSARELGELVIMRLRGLDHSHGFADEKCEKCAAERRIIAALNECLVDTVQLRALLSGGAPHGR